mmetsp:Transcript_11456/g.70391  ORF Transcript_11456/g.70391 Transcript_11456/m.70391 type:complete len:262 (-) Transcript_11456:891-1676(-)
MASAWEDGLAEEVLPFRSSACPCFAFPHLFLLLLLPWVPVGLAVACTRHVRAAMLACEICKTIGRVESVVSFRHVDPMVNFVVKSTHEAPKEMLVKESSKGGMEVMEVFQRRQALEEMSMCHASHKGKVQETWCARKKVLGQLRGVWIRGVGVLLLHIDHTACSAAAEIDSRTLQTKMLQVVVMAVQVQTHALLFQYILQSHLQQFLGVSMPPLTPDRMMANHNLPICLAAAQVGLELVDFASEHFLPCFICTVFLRIVPT